LLLYIVKYNPKNIHYQDKDYTIVDFYNSRLSENHFLLQGRARNLLQPLQHPSSAQLWQTTPGHQFLPGWNITNLAHSFKIIANP
jgi:hypothetical protein